MNTSRPCKCGHDFEKHKSGYSRTTACWHIRRDRYGIPVCPCMNFSEMTNLEYLEYEYQKTL
jgi:endonuclease YncB( thermonuclease family)